MPIALPPFGSSAVLKLIVLFGGLLTFFLSVLAGIVLLSHASFVESWDMLDFEARGTFGAFGLGSVAAVFVITTGVYASMFTLRNYRVAVGVALVTTILATVFLSGVLAAHWRPLKSFLR